MVRLGTPLSSILPPSGRRRRLGRRLRSFPLTGSGDGARGDPRVSGPALESGPWSSPGTDGPASACAARTPSSSTTPIPSIVGPTGRGITGDVVTFSHPDDTTPPKKATKLSRDGGTAIPTSLEPAFVLDGPGEYEVHDVLLTGVRTYRDDAKGARARPPDRVRHGAGRDPHDPPRRHRPPADRGEARRHRPGRGRVRADRRRAHARPAPRRWSPSSTRRSSIPMPVCEDEADCDEALKQFLHEMGAEPTVQPKLAVTPSSLPAGDDHRPPGVARQGLAGRALSRAAQAEPSPSERTRVRERGARRRRRGVSQPPRRWTTRPPLTTTSTRSAPTQ